MPDTHWSVVHRLTSPDTTVRGAALAEVCRTYWQPLYTLARALGAVAGGFLIGLAEELSTYPWIGTESLVSPSYKSAVAFVIMVLVLLFRPQGLMRGRLL